MLKTTPIEIASQAPLSFSNLRAFTTSLVAYAFLAQLAMLLNSPGTNGGTFWPGAGLSLGLLLLLPTRQWGYVLLGVALGEFLGNALQGSSLSGNILWTLANVLEPLLGAALIRRVGGARCILTPAQNMLQFIVFGAVLAPMLGASIGAIATANTLDLPYMQAWPKFYIGNALGVLVLTPVILSRVRFVSPLHWPREQKLFAALLLAISPVILHNWGPLLDLMLPYSYLPFMLWAALRFGIKGTSITVLAIAYLVTFGVLAGYAPYKSAFLPDTHGVTVMQIRLLIASVTALVVASLTSELLRGLSTQKRLMHQAQRDELTGLFNRAGLNFRLERSPQRRETDRTPHLLICDLDSFKPINDQYGHLAGDEVLIEVANRLRSCIREGDAAARIGGDEFVVLLDSSDHPTVEAISSRILEQMAAPFAGSFGTAALSVSIGITQWESDMSIEAAMRAADKALYQAKHAGKNQSMWAPTPSNGALA